MRLLLILLLPACLFAQTGSLRLLTGTWVSEHETDNVTQVIVRVDGARTIVHAWGACHPTDCDWGETDADLWNGIPVAIWKWGFATTRMQLILDRKSTRLNSSHLVISYAVFCLKKNTERFTQSSRFEGVVPGARAPLARIPRCLPAKLNLRICHAGLGPCVIFFFFNCSGDNGVLPFPLPRPSPA